MEKNKLGSNVQATVIATMVSLIAIVGFASSFISNQAKIEMQYSNIQAQIAEINVKLDKRDDEIKSLTGRITVIETELKEK